MASRRKFRIYLAGPITGCNKQQRESWREEVKSKYGSRFEFDDPLDNLVDKHAAPSEVIRADLQAIESADGLLVNMWRESIGTAIGVVHAYQKGRPVVVANPCHFRNLMLEFYTDIMADTPLKAAKALHDLLSAEANWTVMKSGDREDEAFNRRNLTDSLRRACRNSGRDDVLLPRTILPKVIDGLKKTERKIQRRIPTGTIDEEVKEALLDMAEEYPYALRIAEEWQRHHMKKHPRSPVLPGLGGSGVVDVQVISHKSHSTIWGKAIRRLKDIPSAEAREILHLIRSVPGVTRIRLGPFGHGIQKSSCCASVHSSPTPCTIEGKLFEHAIKGTFQAFQVRVQLNENKQNVLDQIMTDLKDNNRWAG